MQIHAAWQFTLLDYNQNKVIAAGADVIMKVWQIVISSKRVTLTHSTQSDVAKDDNDKYNTANHIRAAPGKKI